MPEEEREGCKEKLMGYRRNGNSPGAGEVRIGRGDGHPGHHQFIGIVKSAKIVLEYLTVF